MVADVVDALKHGSKVHDSQMCIRDRARAFAAAKVNQIRKAATEQASTIRDYAQEKGEVIRDKAKKFHDCLLYTSRCG